MIEEILIFIFDILIGMLAYFLMVGLHEWGHIKELSKYVKKQEIYYDKGWELEVPDDLPNQQKRDVIYSGLFYGLLLIILVSFINPITAFLLLIIYVWGFRDDVKQLYILMKERKQKVKV